MKIRSIPHTQYESVFRPQNILVAGVDEAGRGALAGPVVAAAVILPADCDEIEGVRDSKVVSEKQRELLFEVIKDKVLCYGVGIVDCVDIDRINILQATFKAMGLAIEALEPQPGHLLIDGNRFVKHRIGSTTIIDGDALSLSIAAASIIAKVTRDRIMRRLDLEFPHYGFARHKGYATLQHRNAILSTGESSQHRKTFLNNIRCYQKSIIEENL